MVLLRGDDIVFRIGVFVNSVELENGLCDFYVILFRGVVRNI